MTTYTIHFKNGENLNCTIRMGFTDFIVAMNDDRDFIAVEDYYGTIRIINKSEIVYATTEEQVF